MRIRRLFASLAIVALIAACNSTTVDGPTPDELERQEQSLGESSQAYWYEGSGAGLMPNVRERKAMHLTNRFRMQPAPYGFDMAPPQAPFVYQEFMTEAGRWQGIHSVTFDCSCMDDYAGNSCCEVGVKNGQVQCLGPVVTCDDPLATAQEDRWALLNRGPGEIASEIPIAGNQEITAEDAFGTLLMQDPAMFVIPFFFQRRDTAFATAQVSVPIVPDECIPMEDECESGTCTDPDTGDVTCDEATNPDCLGTCAGSGGSGDPCILPAPIDEEMCAEENLPRGYYWGFLKGRTGLPPAVLSDGIAMQLSANLGGDPTNRPVELAVNYYDPPNGNPQEIDAVVDGNCMPLDPWVAPPGEEGGNQPSDAGTTDAGTDGGTVDLGPPDTGEDYVGATYVTGGSFTEGCHRYIFAATDSEGFVHSYPTLGSLGMQVDAGGNVVPNDETCPIWAPDRPDQSCLPSVDQCDDGETRACYSGREGTQDKGICEAGVETCVDGRWQGVCDGETRPDAEESCGDGEDNNCNGVAEEGCPIAPDPDMGGGMTDAGGETDGGPTSPDGGTSGTDGGETTADGGETTTPKKDPEEGCCATVDGGRSQSGLPIALLLLGLLALVRLRTRRGI